MKIFFSSLLFVLWGFHSLAQYSRTFALQGGVTINFLREANTLPGYQCGVGYQVSDKIDSMKPGIGFVTGVINQHKISGGPLFLRLGALLDYKLSNASLNSYGTELIGSYFDRKNIESRYRNLYLLIPIELGYGFGKTQSLYAFAGFNAGVGITNSSNWTYSYMYTQYGVETNGDIDTVSGGPDEIQETLETNGPLIAIEFGLGKILFDRLMIEARVNTGLNVMSEFGGENLRLKQTTAEVVVGLMFGRKFN